MPTIVKHLLAFQSERGYGWTEVHYTNVSTGTVNIESILNWNSVNLLPKRAELLGNDCKLIMQRVSYKLRNGIASQARDQIYIGGTTEKGAGSSESLATVWTNTDSTKKKITHLRGYWDDLVENEFYAPIGVIGAAWQPLFDAYKDLLVNNGFGWTTKNIDDSPAGDVTNYTVGADSRVTFTVTGSAQLTALVGTTQSVKFSKINGSKSVLNRALVCLVKDATTLETVAPIACTPFTGRGRFYIRLVQFVAYARIGAVTAGTRKMGKPLGVLPGRSKARART